ncbi:MAG: ABC transporter ATP-binding protein [Vicingaceae bacterium]
MIRITKLNKFYRVGNHPLHVLKNLDINIEDGEMVAIMGSSGSGKSTLLNILGILDAYDSGDYYLNNLLIKNLTEKKAAEYRNRFLGFVFQSFNLIPFKNAAENVALPLYYQGMARKQRIRESEAMLERVGLLDWKTHLPNELSGGQKQRVAIARALVSNPKLILADEPTGALDSTTSGEVLSLLKEVNEQGMTVIIVTHEMDIARGAHRIVHLKDGEIINSTS